jgi:hypothetical protein
MQIIKRFGYGQHQRCAAIPAQGIALGEQAKRRPRAESPTYFQRSNAQPMACIQSRISFSPRPYFASQANRRALRGVPIQNLARYQVTTDKFNAIVNN